VAIVSDTHVKIQTTGISQSVKSRSAMLQEHARSTYSKAKEILDLVLQLINNQLAVRQHQPLQE
jgi:hypothetical protein